MIAGCDSSSYHPTLDQVKAAYAQGCRVWGGYLPGPSIYSGHTKAFFDVLKAGGMRTLAYCSGYANAAQQKALGASWGVDLICLDVESGIRGDGPWVQPWLDASGAGLYGNLPVMGGRTAPFKIMSAYPGVYPYVDPKATWYGPPPPVPHGWQWAGSVPAYGGSVDRIWFDDWFGTTVPGGDFLAALTDAEQHELLDKVRAIFEEVVNANAQTVQGLTGELKAIASKLDQGGGGTGGGGKVSGTFTGTVG